MSITTWRWYSVSPKGALVPFNDQTPHVPNEPVQAGCLNRRHGPTEYYVDQDGKPIEMFGLDALMVRRMEASGLIRLVREPDHHSPVLSCTCGHYVFKWSEDALALPYVAGYRKLCKVLAVVEVWGKLIEHDLGYRAEWSQLRGICSFGRKVHPVYEVDRAHSVEELIERWEEVE